MSRPDAPRERSWSPSRARSMPAAGYGISLWRRGLFSPISAYLCETTKRRAQLTTASVVQFIKYDEHGQKVNKLVWDDHLLNPMEVIEAIWQEVLISKSPTNCPTDSLVRMCRRLTKWWCANCWSMP